MHKLTRAGRRVRSKQDGTKQKAPDQRRHRQNTRGMKAPMATKIGSMEELGRNKWRRDSHKQN